MYEKCRNIDLFYVGLLLSHTVWDTLLPVVRIMTGIRLDVRYFIVHRLSMKQKFLRATCVGDM